MRGLFFATGHYSSLCVSAVVLTLGGDDIEDGVPDREQVEVGEKQERDNTKRQQTHAQTCDIMDGMWMERMRT